MNIVQEFPFFETAWVQDGLILHTERHIERMKATCIQIFGSFHHENAFNGLSIPHHLTKGKVRLRLSYSEREFKTEWALYAPAKIRKVAIVNCLPGYSYEFKYSDRQYLNDLLESAPSADEIIILKNGMVTDTSKANIVFEKGGKYYTPDTFLLNGTMRQHLLKQGIITLKAIRAEDIFSFEKMFFINALNPLDAANPMLIANVL